MSQSKPSGSLRSPILRSALMKTFGKRLAIWYCTVLWMIAFQRIAAYAAFSGSNLLARAANGSLSGIPAMYVGERCSIVT